MTRHAKNNTASSVYSYHERQRDNRSSGYGTINKRLSKDSIKDFNACNLTLQPCLNPVVTPQGFLYDKEAILEYIIKHKAKIAKDLKRYEKDKLKDEKRLQEASEKDLLEKTEKFLERETKVLTTSSGSSASTNESDVVNTPGTSSSSSSKPGISNMSDGKNKQLPSFWIPNLTPSTDEKLLKKPDTTVKCPMSGKPLKASHLIPVKFTPVDSNCIDLHKAQYKCAVSGDLLTNSSKLVLLKTSGSIITEECWEKLIKKEMIDPINGKTMKDSDIIKLQRGGTGYSSANQLQAKLSKPVMTA